MSRTKQNTDIGHVGTFKVRGPDGKDLEFKAKTTGILANHSPAAADENPAPAEPGPKK